MQRRTIITLLVPIALVVLLLSLQGLAQAPELGTISVQVVGFQNDNGLACTAIYNDADSFPDQGKHFKKSCGKIAKQKAFFRFKDLPPGEYAVYGYHDEDKNRKLKTNFVGMPKEAVGVSRNAKGFMGPPKFKKAKFAVAAGEKKSIRIKVEFL